MSPSLFFTSTGEVAYYTAGVAVLHDFSASKEAPRNRQRFFQSHDDDILYRQDVDLRHRHDAPEAVLC